MELVPWVLAPGWGNAAQTVVTASTRVITAEPVGGKEKAKAGDSMPPVWAWVTVRAMHSAHQPQVSRKIQDDSD